MMMKVELGLSVWNCSLACTATLLPPLWPNNGINLAFASRAQRQPFHFTCAATSPFHSTSTLAPPGLFLCVCGVEGHSWFVLCCLAGSGACWSPPAPEDPPGQATTRWLPGEPRRRAGHSPFLCTNWQGLTLSHPVRRSRAPASEG